MKHSIYKEVQILSTKLDMLGDGQIKQLKVTSLQHVRVVVQPDSGIWSGKNLIFEIKTRNKYPQEPCKVICITSIKHPNILELDGEVCLSMFDDDWCPDMSIEHYMQGILYILHHPNFDDPLSDYFCIAKEQGRIEDAIQQIALA
ncbi:unnamed protein product [Blepharisma stoltei]|uniref:UBC core domain-containing protein n=1 Tax=Blepharisma stoltei TaxID=1481888 RepID=A0AAU9IN40_9CILI|nr:unnamed protein product [Blepharisma stoltei]